MVQESCESESTVTDSDIQGKDTTANPLGDKKKHVCTYEGCNATFCRPNRLAAHMRVHTGEKPFICNHPGCEKAYTNTSHLKRHILSHTSTTVKVKCSHCSIMFSNRHNLKRHYDRVHKDPDKLTCQECKLTFTKRHQLQSHMAMHYDIEYSCDICNRSFPNVRSFRRHKLDHGINAEKYRCTDSECTEAFPKRSQLQQHIKLKHPEELECDVCNKSYIQKWHLKRHKKSHSQQCQPMIPCPYDGCTRLYLHQGNLNQHIKFRHMRIGYECDECKMILCTKKKLEYHILIKHILEKKPRRLKNKPSQRKDAGIPKRSMISQLVGVEFPKEFEKELLSRNTTIQYDTSQDAVTKTTNVT